MNERDQRIRIVFAKAMISRKNISQSQVTTSSLSRNLLACETGYWKTNSLCSRFVDNRVVNSIYASAWTTVHFFFKLEFNLSVLYCTSIWLLSPMSSGSVRRFALQFKDLLNFFIKYRHSPLNVRILTWRSQICSHLVPLTMWSTGCVVATRCWLGYKLKVNQLSFQLALSALNSSTQKPLVHTKLIT